MFVKSRLRRHNLQHNKCQTTQPKSNIKKRKKIGPEEMLLNNINNNGLDEFISDIGLESVTGNSVDRGKFKTPTMRNITVSGPYMHDGRFLKLNEVLDHYESIQKVNQGRIIDIEKPIKLSFNERTDLISFSLGL